VLEKDAIRKSTTLEITEHDQLLVIALPGHTTIFVVYCGSHTSQASSSDKWRTERLQLVRWKNETNLLAQLPEKNPGILFIYSFEKYPKNVLGKSIQKRTFTCQGSLAIFLQKGKIFHLKREASSREVPWSSPPFSDGRFSRIS
jgi:hypothetical protein